MKINKLFLIIISLLVLLAWSPWITKTYAENRVVKIFEEKQRGIIDGCGLNCPGCGVINSNKILFGYTVTIKFKCGMKESFKQNSEFVSFIGTVH